MQTIAQQPGEWIDGFLFVGNRLTLDFLNTRPVLADIPTELLSDLHALERWLIASGIVSSARTQRLMKEWRSTPTATAFLKELIAFRERLRAAVLRIEKGGTPSDEFLQEVNAGLQEHPLPVVLRNREGAVVREADFDPQRPQDIWAPLLYDTADLLSEPEKHRLRRCPACVVHFFDTSKKGSRRWCSMNICGNKLKVAAYQQRKRNNSRSMQ